MTYEEKEDEKYSWLYENGYGHGPVRSAMEWFSKTASHEWPPGNIVDLGCGRATLHAHGWKSYTGIDVSSSIIEKNKQEIHDARFIHGSITSTPFRDGEFDASFCIDVLEHLPEEMAMQAIKEASRIAPMNFVSISTRPSGHKSREGGQLHLTIKPASWWIKLFETLGMPLQNTRIGKDWMVAWTKTFTKL